MRHDQSILEIRSQTQLRSIPGFAVQRLLQAPRANERPDIAENPDAPRPRIQVRLWKSCGARPARRWAPASACPARKESAEPHSGRLDAFRRGKKPCLDRLRRTFSSTPLDENFFLSATGPQGCGHHEALRHLPAPFIPPPSLRTGASPRRRPPSPRRSLSPPRSALGIATTVAFRATLSCVQVPSALRAFEPIRQAGRRRRPRWRLCQLLGGLQGDVA